MKNVRLAKRYAQSLFDFAIEQNQLEQVYTDILLVEQVLKSEIELVRVIESPVIPMSRKGKIFKEVFGEKTSKITTQFLGLVVMKKREPALLSFCGEFINLYQRFHDIKVVKFVTAKPVSETVCLNMQNLLQEKLNANIILQQEIDENLIGGFVFRVDDFVYDASIVKQLEMLKREFSYNSYQVGF